MVHWRSLPMIRVLVLVLLFVGAVVRPTIVLACDVEDARLALQHAAPTEGSCPSPPDPDADVDRLVHCCGHLLPLVIAALPDLEAPWPWLPWIW